MKALRQMTKTERLLPQTDFDLQDKPHLVQQTEQHVRFAVMRRRHSCGQWFAQGFLVYCRERLLRLKSACYRQMLLRRFLDGCFVLRQLTGRGRFSNLAPSNR